MMTHEDLLKDLKATFGVALVDQETNRLVLRGLKMQDGEWLAIHAFDAECGENHDFITGLHFALVAWLGDRGWFAHVLDSIYCELVPLSQESAFDALKLVEVKE